jgi:hypothetical protein
VSLAEFGRVDTEFLRTSWCAAIGRDSETCTSFICLSQTWR